VLEFVIASICACHLVTWLVYMFHLENKTFYDGGNMSGKIQPDATSTSHMVTCFSLIKERKSCGNTIRHHSIAYTVQMKNLYYLKRQKWFLILPNTFRSFGRPVGFSPASSASSSYQNYFFPSILPCAGFPSQSVI
jgi:hypothetical protein